MKVFKETKKYKMSIDEGKKLMVVFAEGFFTLKDGESFIEDYQATVNEIDSSYSLILDTKGVKPSTPDVANALGDAIKLYIATPFKKRFVVKVESATAQMQVQRLGKSIPNFDLLTFVDSKEDALSQL